MEKDTGNARKIRSIDAHLLCRYKHVDTETDTHADIETCVCVRTQSVKTHLYQISHTRLKWIEEEEERTRGRPRAGLAHTN